MAMNRMWTAEQSIADFASKLEMRQMDMTTYVLPDGTEVAVDSTAAKGALIIGFTLKGGKVVDAVRADSRMAPSLINRLLEAELRLIRAEDHLRLNPWNLRVKQDAATYDAIEILRNARADVLRAQLVEERKS